MINTVFSTFDSDAMEHLGSNVLQAGNKDEGLMFLLTDSQITNERFLIYINDLLASGNIPDLFAVDEVDSIVSRKLAGMWLAGGFECTKYLAIFRVFLYFFVAHKTKRYAGKP